MLWSVLAGTSQLMPGYVSCRSPVYVSRERYVTQEAHFIGRRGRDSQGASVFEAS